MAKEYKLPHNEQYLNVDGVKALIQKIGATIGEVLKTNQEIISKFNELNNKVDAVYNALQWLYADDAEALSDQNPKLIKSYKV